MLKKRTRHLANKDEMLFDKELGLTQSVNNKFGWTKTGSADSGIWRKMLQYGVDYLSEELGEDKDKDGKVVKVKYGVERIPFVGLLKEMQSYQIKGNFDRIIAYVALITFAKIQQSNGIVKKRVERKTDNTTKKTANFGRQDFLKSIGRSTGTMIKRSLNFRTLR